MQSPTQIPKIMLIYLNGTYSKLNDATLSPLDRGFLFGDGIYEVIRVVNGQLVLENEHLERMEEGLSGIGIDMDSSALAEIPEISRELIRKNELEENQAKVYIQVTRGAANPRTHTFPDPPVDPTLFLSAEPFIPHTELHQTGVDVITVPDVRWLRCNLKTVNLLPNSLAKQRAKEAGVNSAIMIRDGVVTESPNANVFGVKGDTLYTYPATNYILNGITRQAVLGFADELGIPVVEQPIREEEMFQLDELFFTGTTTDIQPINNVDGRKIGTGKPGPVVKEIQDAYEELLHGR